MYAQKSIACYLDNEYIFANLFLDCCVTKNLIAKVRFLSSPCKIYARPRPTRSTIMVCVYRKKKHAKYYYEYSTYLLFSMIVSKSSLQKKSCLLMKMFAILSSLYAVYEKYQTIVFSQIISSLIITRKIIMLICQLINFMLFFIKIYAKLRNEIL